MLRVFMKQRVAMVYRHTNARTLCTMGKSYETTEPLAYTKHSSSHIEEVHTRTPATLPEGSDPRDEQIASLRKELDELRRNSSSGKENHDAKNITVKRVPITTPNANGWVRKEKDDEGPDYLQAILTSRVYELATETNLHKAPTLSKKLGNTVMLKREDLQPVFSFKLRGAYNKMANLTPEERKRGVVCCSAGNHAQGVAMSAVHLGIDAKIVMPTMTPAIKVSAVRDRGGLVILHGDNFDEAAAEADRLRRVEGRVFVSPFNDPAVIAGQGTIGMEIVKQMQGQDLDAVFCAVGGGGLIGGIGAFLKRCRPDVRVVGVEARDSAAMTLSLQAGERVQLDHVGLFADGAAVRLVGDETFRLAQQVVDEMVTVSADEICAAIKDGFNDTRAVLEPAGALSIAGATKWLRSNGHEGKTVVAVASGSNMDFDRLRFVSDRADASETLLSVDIPEVPGSFLALLQLIHPCNITEVNYRHHSSNGATVFLSLQDSKQQSVAEVVQQLQQQRYPVEDFTSNDMAKTHGRYLCGGRAPEGFVEQLYSFEFRQQPGALFQFVSNLCHDELWNMTLWHYRDHGSDCGRMLVGVQVPPGKLAEFESFLDRLGYLYVNETNNPAYRVFLVK